MQAAPGSAVATNSHVQLAQPVTQVAHLLQLTTRLHVEQAHRFKQQALKLAARRHDLAKQRLLLPSPLLLV